MFNSYYILRAFEVLYSKAMKEIFKVTIYSGNHEIAEKCSLMLLKHHLAITHYRHDIRLLHSVNYILKHNIPCFKEGHSFKHKEKKSPRMMWTWRAIVLIYSMTRLRMRLWCVFVGEIFICTTLPRVS